MYALINQHVGRLLREINLQRDIQPYEWLLNMLPTVDVSNHAEFQRVYRRYWQLNVARLSPDYLEAYFAYLERLKGQPVGQDTGEAVARQLYATSTHGNGRQSIQFSFATKLVHMLAPEQPVYDSMIESFFFLPAARQKEKPERKFTRLQTSYTFLQQEYGRVLQHGLLAPAIARFRAHCNVGMGYTDTKIIDTLIWKFVAMLKAGAIRDGVVVFG